MGRSLQHAAMALPKGYLWGLTLSTAGASTTFSVAAGECTDSTNADWLSIGAISKTTSAWVVGSTNGGLDTGSIAASTWYHVYLMKRPDTGVVDVMFTTNANYTTAAGNIPGPYTLFKRIGSLRTNGSSQWALFKQLGDEFLWDVDDAGGSAFLTGTIGTTASLVTATVPTGIQVQALIRGQHIAPSASSYMLLSSPDQSDQSAASALSTAAATTGAYGSGEFSVRTNTSGQIRARANIAATTVYGTTRGWVDTRGKLY